MKIIDDDKTAAFGKRYPPAKNPLSRWKSTTASATWKNSAEMKETFRLANVVGIQTVFNIGGNKYRLIAMIHYAVQTVIVQFVLTHAEYDKGDWKL